MMGGVVLDKLYAVLEYLKAKENMITKHNISSATIDRMKKGKGISTAKLDDFCKILGCKVSDIIEYKQDD